MKIPDGKIAAPTPAAMGLGRFAVVYHNFDKE